MFSRQSYVLGSQAPPIGRVDDDEVIIIIINYVSRKNYSEIFNLVHFEIGMGYQNLWIIAYAVPTIIILVLFETHLIDNIQYNVKRCTCTNKNKCHW